jgi:hypothetical protein
MIVTFGNSVTCGGGVGVDKNQLLTPIPDGK